MPALNSATQRCGLREEGGRREVRAAEPVTNLGLESGHENRRPILDGQRRDLALAKALEQGVAERGLPAPLGGAIRRIVRDDAVHDFAQPAIKPVVIDDAMIARRAAGQKRRMARGRHGGRIGIMAIAEPGPFLHEPFEAACAELTLPFLQVVAPQLIEDDNNGQPGTPLAFLRLSEELPPRAKVPKKRTIRIVRCQYFHMLVIVAATGQRPGRG